MNKQTSKTDTERSTTKRPERKLPDGVERGRRHLRLLIVEDYDGFRESLQLYFEYFGYVVEAVDSYKTAIKAAKHNPPDVLICDWHINGNKDGTEVAREIYGRYRSTIIFVSGSSTNRLRAATIDLPDAYYFQKPASVGEIASVIQSVERVT